jgi:hypothetical protein
MMTEDEFPAGVSREVERAADEPMDASDVRLLGEVAQLLSTVDPVPDDLVDRIRFSLALDEMHAEIASITRMEADELAVRGEPAAGTRTETLTFSSDSLTAMVTVARTGPGQVRLDGWLAPPAALRIQLRMQEGHREVVADESGRFVVEGLSEGFAQLSFHPPAGDVADQGAGVVVTPLFQL